MSPDNERVVAIELVTGRIYIAKIDPALLKQSRFVELSVVKTAVLDNSQGLRLVSMKNSLSLFAPVLEVQTAHIVTIRGVKEGSPLYNDFMAEISGLVIAASMRHK
jgi:hypothetical protein